MDHEHPRGPGEAHSEYHQKKKEEEKKTTTEFKSVFKHRSWASAGFNTLNCEKKSVINCRFWINCSHVWSGLHVWSGQDSWPLTWGHCWLVFFSCLDFSCLRFFSSQQRQEQQPGGERPGNANANANVANVLLYKGNACERRRGRCRASTKKKTAQITNTNKTKLDWKKLLECWNYSGKKPCFLQVLQFNICNKMAATPFLYSVYS